MTEDCTTLMVDGVPLQLCVIRKRVKNVNARLRGDRLLVSAPFRLARGELDRIVPELARKLLRRKRAKQVNSEAEAHELAQKVAARFPEPPKITEVRFVATQTSSYGSYSQRTGIVRLNIILRQMPREVLEAIVAHELAHAVHPDHSAGFWHLLRQVCPQTDRVRGFLRGVQWLASAWHRLPPVERTLLGLPETDGPQQA